MSRLGAGDAVLFVTPHFRPHVGGVEQYVEQLAETLHERHGLRPVVVTTSSPDATAAAQPRDSPIEIRNLHAPARVFNTPVGPGWMRALRRLGEMSGRRLIAGERVIIPEQANRSGADAFVATSSVGLPLRTVVMGLMPGYSLASAVRATRSARIRKAAPPSAESGSSRR